MTGFTRERQSPAWTATTTFPSNRWYGHMPSTPIRAPRTSFSPSIFPPSVGFRDDPHVDDHRDYWLWLGSACILIALATAGLAGAFAAARKHFNFWGSPELIVAYVLLAGGVLCFIGAVRGKAFPLARSARQLPQGAPFPPPGPVSAATDDPVPVAPKGAGVPAARRVVDVTPESLAAFHRDHMSMQADKLTAPVIGKWMKHSGRLSDVSSYHGDLANGFAQVTFELPPVPDRIQVYMLFRDGEVVEQRLAVLKKGDPVTVLGQIQWAHAYEMQLDNCELVEPDR